MKLLFLSMLIVFCFTAAAAQPVPVESAFDFWVGHWNLHWFTKDSVRVDGTNEIGKILDGKVLQEYFEDPTTDFRGTSISVFRPSDSTWRQAWADNQGSYFDFIGEVDGDTRIFRTHGPGADSAYQRMRFHDITPDAFIWDWEGTRDGGRTWNPLWRIFYERAGTRDTLDN
jgi:hypothetical protein